MLLVAALLGGAGTAVAEPGGPALSAAPHLVQQASPNLWAAIALGPNSLATGYAWDYPSAEAASQAAVARCRARDCQMIVQVTNGCGSLAQASNYNLGWSYGPSRGASDQGAINGTKGSHARVLGWVCSGYYQ